MNETFWGAAIVMAGIVGLAFIILFNDITTKNEQDYYLLKEITEAALIESIDETEYRAVATPTIIKEKFVENFIRRFAQSVGGANMKNYKIEFYALNENPPKVSVRISTDSDNFKVTGEAFTIVNQIDAIIETKY